MKPIIRFISKRFANVNTFTTYEPKKIKEALSMKPKYFDVVRRTKYQYERRDYRHLTFNTQNPLFFDHDNAEINGGIETLLENIRVNDKTLSDIGTFKSLYLMYNLAKVNYPNVQDIEALDNNVNIRMIPSEKQWPCYIYGGLYVYYHYGIGKLENVNFFEDVMTSSSYKELRSFINRMGPSYRFIRSFPPL